MKKELTVMLDPSTMEIIEQCIDEARQECHVNNDEYGREIFKEMILRKIDDANIYPIPPIHVKQVVGAKGNQMILVTVGEENA